MLDSILIGLDRLIDSTFIRLDRLIDLTLIIRLNRLLDSTFIRLDRLLDSTLIRLDRFIHAAYTVGGPLTHHVLIVYSVLVHTKLSVVVRRLGLETAAADEV